MNNKEAAMRIKEFGLYHAIDDLPNSVLTVEAFKIAIKALEFKDYFDDLYGKGLEIANWHLNGELEPFDSFYESANDCSFDNQEVGGLF